MTSTQETVSQPSDTTHMKPEEGSTHPKDSTVPTNPQKDPVN